MVWFKVVQLIGVHCITIGIVIGKGGCKPPFLRLDKVFVLYVTKPMKYNYLFYSFVENIS
jgi:hypothetical protein